MMNEANTEAKMQSPLTSYQRMALHAMADDNLGAIVTKFGWTWPEHVRNSEEKAIAVLEILSARRKA